MAVPGNHWVVFDDVGDVATHRVLSVDGDTLIDGRTYQKVYARKLLGWEGILHPDEVPPPPYEVSAQRSLHGFLRDDVAERRVYGIAAELYQTDCDPGAEVLLHDFGQVAGDTLGGCLRDCYGPVVLDSIGARDIFGAVRTTHHYDSYELAIEGIGHLSGPFYNPCSIVVTKGNRQLVGFCNGSDEACLLAPTAVHTLGTGMRVSIHPNPATDVVYVRTEGDCRQPLAVVLRDLQGRVLRQETVACAGSISLPVSDYPAGVYVLTVRSGNGRVVERIVVE